MSDSEEVKPLVPPVEAKSVNSAAMEEADSRVWKDSDILQHVSKLVNAKLESSRNADFMVELSYSELRLIVDAVNIAVSRTKHGNQLVDVYSKRSDLVKQLAQRIAEVVEVKVQ